jgi:glycosyltransferase involved in cell wall biosynthesis
VNDGSTDSSHDIIEKFIAEHGNERIQYTYQKNTGKGGALKNGFSLARGDAFLVQDADLEYEPSDIAVMLAKMEKTSSDIIYGSRVR